MANRRRAVLLTAQAQAAEDTAADKALELAREAHRLAPDLVPAAAIAGRMLASQGNTPRAARVLLRTWRLSPHPDLAAAYAYARPGDSPRDRLNRVRHLARLTPHDSEGPIALAITAIEAREWDEAREALEPLLEDRLTQRVATLMARIEGEQHGHTGRVREWLARAVNAPRDPAWTADGVVSDRWAPVSPVTGALDAFRWRVPVEAVDAAGGRAAGRQGRGAGRPGGRSRAGAGAMPGRLQAGGGISRRPRRRSHRCALGALAEAAREVTAPPAPAVVTLRRSASRRPAQAGRAIASRSERRDGLAVTKPARLPQAETPDEDDLRERIRLAAQRAIAASNAAEPIAAAPRARPRRPFPQRGCRRHRRLVRAGPPSPRSSCPRAHPTTPAPSPPTAMASTASPLRPVKA